MCKLESGERGACRLPQALDGLATVANVDMNSRRSPRQKKKGATLCLGGASVAVQDLNLHRRGRVVHEVRVCNGLRSDVY